MEGGAIGHNIERGPPKDHPSQICFNLVQLFQTMDGRTPSDGKSSLGLWPGELKNGGKI
jgi:hypothetical protein